MPDDIGTAPDAVEPGSDAEKVRDALREVIDPEVGINVVDLGLVYGLMLDESRAIVTMTMTTPACPLGDLIQSQAAEAVEAVLPGRAVEVRLVWQPPWTRHRMSLAARRMLGFDE
ncbi:MAG: metal-sulfur cluster assembly factor [Myxococcales bacterium]|nr:metal-sulfur cluster assembly factor [Myxococcales bacterium]